MQNKILRLRNNQRQNRFSVLFRKFEFNNKIKNKKNRLIIAFCHLLTIDRLKVSCWLCALNWIEVKAMESVKSGVGFIIEAIHLSSSDMQKSLHQIWRYCLFRYAGQKFFNFLGTSAADIESALIANNRSSLIAFCRPFIAWMNDTHPA